MKVLVRNGFIIFDWEGKPNKPRLENNDLLGLPQNARNFLDAIRRPNYELGEPSVDLRYGPYKLSSNPYFAFVQLRWVRGKANRNGIERDESFEALYRELRDEYFKAVDDCDKEYVAKKTERAQKAWEEEKAKRGTKECEYCYYCDFIYDGCVKCRKYRKTLETTVGERYDMVSGKYYMYADIAHPCEECKEAEGKALEEEKAKFIDKYINKYREDIVEDMVALRMSKGVVSYG